MHCTNEELVRKIIKAFEDCDLMGYFCHDYSSTYRREVFLFYLNAREENGTTLSRVTRVDMFITTKDIRSKYGFLATTNLDFSSHSFNQ